MKTKIVLLFSFLFTASIFAQDIAIVKSKSEPIPFQLVEIPPLAPDCKVKWKIEKQKKCTKEFIINHVNRKFNVELAPELGLTGRIRIDVTFIIDKEGKPKDINATGGPEIMNQEAIEVIQNLPQLTPASQNGETVEIIYKLPILFDII